MLPSATGSREAPLDLDTSSKQGAQAAPPAPKLPKRHHQQSPDAQAAQAAPPAQPSTAGLHQHQNCAFSRPVPPGTPEQRRLAPPITPEGIMEQDLERLKRSRSNNSSGRGSKGRSQPRVQPMPRTPKQFQEVERAQDEFGRLRRLSQFRQHQSSAPTAEHNLHGCTFPAPWGIGFPHPNASVSDIAPTSAPANAPASHTAPSNAPANDTAPTNAPASDTAPTNAPTNDTAPTNAPASDTAPTNAPANMQ